MESAFKPVFAWQAKYVETAMLLQKEHHFRRSIVSITAHGSDITGLKSLFACVFQVRANVCTLIDTYQKKKHP